MFDSQIGGLVAAIWIMDADGSHQRRLTAAPIEAGFSDMSPDGKRVAFINHQNTSLRTSIFRMKLDGSAITRLTNAGPLHDVQPVYSPDGNKIAFVSDRRSSASEHDQDLYVMHPDGTHITRIVTGLTVGGCPRQDNCVEPGLGPRAVRYRGVAVTVIGDHEERTVAQLERCVRAEDGARGVLCADGHVGY